MSARLPIYSTFFTTLYDESGPLTDLGSGAHHSVLRSVHWLDTRGNRRPSPQVHQVAVVWDHRHDTRVIDVVEQLHRNHLLGPIAIIGESRGTLTTLLHADYLQNTGAQAITSYLHSLDALSIGPNDGERWTLRTGTFVPQPHSQSTQPLALISDDPVRVKNYLSGIDAFWPLGLMPWQPRGSVFGGWANPHDPALAHA